MVNATQSSRPAGIGPIRAVAPSLASGDPNVAQPLDAARAERLRTAIEGGRYPLDARRLADTLIALGLVGKGDAA